MERDVEKYLSENAPGTRLVILGAGEDISVQIEAPEGYHFDGSLHSMPIADNENLSFPVFWAHVLSEIKVKDFSTYLCSDGGCEGYRDFGACEFWGN